MPNPARKLELKKHIPLLPFPKTVDDEEKLDIWISSVRKTLHLYSRATPFLLEQVECGLLESLVLLVGSPRPYISPFVLDIMEWLSRDSPSTAQKIASHPALPSKLLKVFESGLVTEKQFASNLVMQLNLHLAGEKDVPFFQNNYSWFVNFIIALSSFVCYSISDFNAEMNEQTNDPRQPFYQANLIKPQKSLAYVRQYGPRYVAIINEAGSQALALCTGVIICSLRKFHNVVSRAELRRLFTALLLIWDKSCTTPLPILEYAESCVHLELLVTVIPLATMPCGFDAEHCTREEALSYLSAEFLEAMATPLRLANLKKIMKFFDFRLPLPLPDPKTIRKTLREHHAEIEFTKDDLEEFESNRFIGVSRTMMHLSHMCMCPSTAAIVAADDELVQYIQTVVTTVLPTGAALIADFNDSAAFEKFTTDRSLLPHVRGILMSGEDWKAWGPNPVEDITMFVAFHPISFDSALVSLLHLQLYMGASAIQLDPSVLPTALARARMYASSADKAMKVRRFQDAAVRYGMAQRLTLLQRRGAAAGVSAEYSRKLQAAMQRARWVAAPLKRDGPEGSGEIASRVAQVASDTGGESLTGLVPGLTQLTCSMCHKASRPGDSPLQHCSRCYTVVYCGQLCQRAHWPAHKASCKPRAKD